MPTPRTLARPDFSIERTYWDQGHPYVLGTDECGRGPIAGPTFAGAVVLSPWANEADFDWARDSKALSRAKIARYASAMLNGDYREKGLLAWGIGAASVREIDRLNIRRASILAMQRAIEMAERRLRMRGDIAADQHVSAILVDGLPAPELGRPHQAIVRGDSRSVSIACAAILAKHLRDKLMERLAIRHPHFSCWASDRGYPSPAHLEALRTHGPVHGHHRTSFRPVAELALL